MSSSPSSVSAPAPIIAPANYSMVDSKPRDAQESNVDSSIPTQACAYFQPPSNIVDFIALSSSSKPPQREDSIPQTLVRAAESLPRPSSTDGVPQIQESLGNIGLDKDYLISNGDGSSQCAPDASLVTLVPTKNDTPNNLLRGSTSSSGGAPAHSSHPASSDGYDVLKRPVGLDGAEASPAIVVSSQKLASIAPVPTPPAQAGMEILIDEPDQRLIDALENQRDRLFVIKLEQDVIDFIEKNSSEVFDMPPINAYHRLLTHKMAEYYRLTHVADTSGTSVRLYRGQSARIPPVRLSEKRLPSSMPNPSATNAAKSNFKIMQRSSSNRGSDTPPEQQNGSAPKKTTSESSSGDGSARVTTREEREQAYQEARARIFKDFVESPPETPAPSKPNEKARKQEKPDEFHGRSQFYAVPTPAPPINSYFPPQYDDPRLHGQNNAHLPGVSRFNPSIPSFNPNPSTFVPPSSGYTPQPQSFMPPLSNRQFPQQADRSFPAPVHMGLNVFSQQHQQRNGYYPEQAGNFHNGNPQQNPVMMPANFNNQRFSVQPPLHGQHSGPVMPPSIPATTNRHPYASPSNYAVGNQGLGNQRFQLPHQQPLASGNGWSTPQMVNGGIPMTTRSHSALAALDRPTPPFGGMPYQNHQQSPHWGGNSVVASSATTNFRKGPFGGTGGPGMHGPVGGM